VLHVIVNILYWAAISSGIRIIVLITEVVTWSSYALLFAFACLILLAVMKIVYRPGLMYRFDALELEQARKE